MEDGLDGLLEEVSLLASDVAFSPPPASIREGRDGMEVDCDGAFTLDDSRTPFNSLRSSSFSLWSFASSLSRSIAHSAAARRLSGSLSSMTSNSASLSGSSSSRLPLTEGSENSGLDRSIMRDDGWANAWRVSTFSVFCASSPPSFRITSRSNRPIRVILLAREFSTVSDVDRASVSHSVI